MIFFYICLKSKNSSQNCENPLKNEKNLPIGDKKISVLWVSLGRVGFALTKQYFLLALMKISSSFCIRPLETPFIYFPGTTLSTGSGGHPGATESVGTAGAEAGSILSVPLMTNSARPLGRDPI